MGIILARVWFYSLHAQPADLAGGHIVRSRRKDFDYGKLSAAVLVVCAALAAGTVAGCAPGARTITTGAEVLAFFYRDKFNFDVTSEVASGVVRRFSSFSAAAQEAGISRIYAGQHFRFDHNAGKRQGRRVAESVDETILLPR